MAVSGEVYPRFIERSSESRFYWLKYEFLLNTKYVNTFDILVSWGIKNEKDGFVGFSIDCLFFCIIDLIKIIAR